MKKLILVILFFLSGFVAQAQTTIYRADSWDNIRLYKTTAAASEHPVAAQVSVTVSGRIVKTNFSGKLLSYRILNTSHPSDTETDYSLMLQGKKYALRIVHDGDVYTVICLNEWALHNITEVTTFD